MNNKRRLYSAVGSGVTSQRAKKDLASRESNSTASAMFKSFKKHRAGAPASSKIRGGERAMRMQLRSQIAGTKELLNDLKEMNQLQSGRMKFQASEKAKKRTIL